MLIPTKHALRTLHTRSLAIRWSRTFFSGEVKNNSLSYERVVVTAHEAKMKILANRDASNDERQNITKSEKGYGLFAPVACM